MKSYLQLHRQYHTSARPHDARQAGQLKGMCQREERCREAVPTYRAVLRFVFSEIFRLQVFQPLIKLFRGLLADDILIRKNRRTGS